MMILAVTIEGQPVPKARPRFSRTGHAYTPARSKKYESRVKDAVWAEARLRGWKCVTGAFALRIRVAHKGVMDLDNIAKQVADACEKAKIFTNDRNMDILQVVRDRESTSPYLHFSIEALD